MRLSAHQRTLACEECFRSESILGSLPESAGSLNQVEQCQMQGAGRSLDGWVKGCVAYQFSKLSSVCSGAR